MCLDSIKGFFAGMSDDDYFAHRGINNSSLTAMLMDGAEVFYQQEIVGKKKKATAAMDFGTIAHDVILRPDQLGDTYVLANEPVNPSTGNPYGKDTKKYEDWRDGYHRAGQVPLPTNDFALAMRMSERASAHPVIGPLLRAAKLREAALFTESKRYGLTLKCKVDALILNPDLIPEAKGLVADETLSQLDLVFPQWRTFGSILIDLKTTAMYRKFRSVCRKRHYYRADAYYTHIAQEVFGQPSCMLFVPIETASPMRMSVKRIDEDSSARGLEEMDEALNLIYDHLALSKQPEYENAPHLAWVGEAENRIEDLHLFAGVKSDQMHALASFAESVL